MRRQLLTLTTSTFILACLGLAVNAQQGTGGPAKMQEGQQTQQQTERASPAHYRDDDDDDWHGQRMMRRWRDEPGRRCDDNRDGWHGRRMQGWRDGPSRRYDDERDNWRGRGMHGWRDGPGRRGAGPEAGSRAVMGPGPHMMGMMMILADADNDGAVSLQEFQAAHERMFKAMDTDKDGRLTLEELQSFRLGPRGPAQQQ